LAIIDAAWRLRRVKLGQLVTGRNLAPERIAGAALDVPLRARELALAVQRAAQHGFMRPECLVRSLALRRLFERNGIKGSEIVVGVRREDERLLAHAWVELNGSVIGDRVDHVSRFVRLEGLAVNSLG
jgi:hypothetical protein